MKNLFILLVVASVSLGASAQTNVNLEKLNQKANKKITLKFIEGIELIPEGRGRSNETEIEKPVTKPVVSESEKPTATNSAEIIEQCESWQFKYAMMMNTEVEKITNKKLYSFIDDWWATRYRYGGTTKMGIDCSAFTGTLFNDVYGVNLPRTARDQFAVTSAVEKIYKWDLQEGDLVFFNTRGGVSHVGVYLGNDFFVHSSVHDGVTISSLDDDYYHSKFISGGRVSKIKSPTETKLTNEEEIQ